MWEFYETYKGNFYALLTALSWALAVIFLKLAGPMPIRSTQVNFIRNNIALLFLFLTIGFTESHWLPPLALSDWLKIIASSLFGIAIGDVFLFSSIKRTGAGFQSIIDCIYSPTMIFLAALFLGDPITSHQVIGATFIILSILLSSRGFSSQENQSSGIIFGVLAQISVVIGILIITDLFSKVSILHLTTLRLLFGQFFLVLIMRPKKEHLKTLFWPVERKEFKYVFLSALFGSFLATYFWLLGFKYSVVGNAAIYNQTSSLFIFILAWIFLKEQFTLKKGFSLIMALLGAIAVSL